VLQAKIVSIEYFAQIDLKLYFFLQVRIALASSAWSCSAKTFFQLAVFGKLGYWFFLTCVVISI